ncbi:MAG: hypothetical protein K6E80_02240 [Schwartzia sp.]|nr:hypothetical protein [Schwartzia sp. (in: firmicutes)]
MKDAAKVMLNKAKDIKAWCQNVECDSCVFMRSNGACRLNEADACRMGGRRWA